ncbi:DUF6204 family protein [Prauserella cavernicola]|uniref:Uncharacterized protein n=1 Tax=Prauserella cavernicola TaxID=2800127 RepID=A0A934R111_9PSEU|nr:DUF6204 family protein [Prauserella cavernicola]MBK1788858.1 hypothetical protein [Prauserella cavernicola]
MLDRTYRVLVRGTFAGLSDDTRARLRAEADEHSLLRSGFTREGTLTYDRSLRPFTFRIEVSVPAGEREERDAADEGELAAIETLAAAGYPHGELTTTATNQDDIKIRSR